MILSLGRNVVNFNFVCCCRDIYTLAFINSFLALKVALSFPHQMAISPTMVPLLALLLFPPPMDVPADTGVRLVYRNTVYASLVTQLMVVIRVRSPSFGYTADGCCN